MFLKIWSLKISSIAAAEAAGISRVTLHRIEKGEASVSMGAYINTLLALGLRLETTTAHAPSESAMPSLPSG